MPKPPAITGKKIIASGWATFTRYQIAQDHADGTTRTHLRDVHDHGSAAAVLLLDSARRTVVLVRQFRLPALLNGDESFLLEACAGLLEGDDPRTCAAREALEETGIAPQTLIHAFDIYASPGAVTEKVHCFVGLFSQPDRIGAGGGLDHEGEDIEIVEIGFEDALPMTRTGAIVDAKTVALIQFAALEGYLA